MSFEETRGRMGLGSEHAKRVPTLMYGNPSVMALRPLAFVSNPSQPISLHYIYPFFLFPIKAAVLVSEKTKKKKKSSQWKTSLTQPIYTATYNELQVAA